MVFQWFEIKANCGCIYDELRVCDMSIPNGQDGGLPTKMAVCRSYIKGCLSHPTQKRYKPLEK